MRWTAVADALRALHEGRMALFFSEEGGEEVLAAFIAAAPEEAVFSNTASKPTPCETYLRITLGDLQASPSRYLRSFLDSLGKVLP